MFCPEGSLSLWCFAGTSGSLLLIFAPQIVFNLSDNSGTIYWGPLLYYALINMIIRFGLKGTSYQIGIRATFLGFIFAISLLVAFYAPVVWRPFGIYGVFMSIFHYSEYFTIAWCNPRSLSVESFILNHSVHYFLAAVASWMEYTIEALLLPDLKKYYIFWIVGIIMCSTGETLRKMAMFTAKSNFNHMVQYTKSDDHHLVTHGIYGKMRHPSYVGWFWWSIGTQVILCNPICVIIYAVASWKFFNERIYVEENTLLNFFGKQYFDYQKRVPTGLPFIKGFCIKLQSEAH